MKYEIRVHTFQMLGNKKYYLNLNSYRNWNFRVSNLLKVKFKESIFPLIPKSINGPVEITYQLFAKDRRRRDKGNVLCIVQKFLLDAITESGAWDDDNDNIVGKETFLPTVIDPEKIGFVLVIINEIGTDLEMKG